MVWYGDSRLLDSPRRWPARGVTHPGAADGLSIDHRHRNACSLATRVLPQHGVLNTPMGMGVVVRQAGGVRVYVEVDLDDGAGELTVGWSPR